MSVFQTVEEARAFFADDLFAINNGVVIEELGEGWSLCSLTITPNHRNAAGGVMGGAIFTLADLAFAVAANNMHKTTVTQQVSINFLSGTRGTRLFARAQCKKDGRTSCVYNVDVTDDLGRDVAQFIATGSKL